MRLLAIIAESQTAPACLNAASAAAASASMPVAVRALHVIVDPRMLCRAPEEVAIQGLRERAEGTAQVRANAARSAFANWAEARPADAPKVVWKEQIGAVEENVAREAAQFDLLVMARPVNMDGRDALHTAFFAASRPLLLVSSDWKAGRASFPQNIVIAWNDSAQACRAVDGAMPWLRRAASVTILLIAEPSEIADALVERLTDEGIIVRVLIAERSASSLGHQIIDIAHEVGADLLVMGAFRHNQFVAWMMGRTTNHALRRADLPLLLSH